MQNFIARVCDSPSVSTLFPPLTVKYKSPFKPLSVQTNRSNSLNFVAGLSVGSWVSACTSASSSWRSTCGLARTPARPCGKRTARRTGRASCRTSPSRTPATSSRYTPGRTRYTNYFLSKTEPHVGAAPKWVFLSAPSECTSIQALPCVIDQLDKIVWS